MKSRGGVVCCFAAFATAATFAAFPVFPAFTNRFGADACLCLAVAFGRRDFAADFCADVARRAADFGALGFAAPGFDAFGFDAFGFDAVRPDAVRPDAFLPDAFRPDAFRPDAFDPAPDFFAAVPRFVRGAAFFTAFLTLPTPRLRLVTDVARVRHFFGIQSINGATNVNSNRTRKPPPRCP